MKNTLTYALFALLVLSLSACEGDEGPMGPAGAANVTVEFFNLTNSNANVSDDGEVVYWEFNNISGIDSHTLENGVQIAYTDLGSSGWIALPFSYTGSSAEYSVNYFVGENTLEVALFSELAFLIYQSFAGHRVKLVIIPPSEINNSLDLTDYDAVSNYYDFDKIVNF